MISCILWKNTLYSVLSLILTTFLGNRYYYYPYLKEEKAEKQRGQEIYPVFQWENQSCDQKKKQSGCRTL